MPANEFYEKSGRHYERVTNILKIIHNRGLEDFRRARGFAYVDGLFNQAAIRGKSFHSAMRLIVEGNFNGILEETFEDNPMSYEIFLAKDWLKENVEKVLIVEKTFYDDQHGYAGTPDLVCIMKGQRQKTLIDWKTGSIIPPTARLQLAAYTGLIEKSTDMKISRRLIIQVNGGKLKVHKIKTSKQLDIALFQYALYLHRNID